MKRFFHGQFKRFVWTGIFNTINGYVLILGLQIITDRPLLANLVGYGIAATIGYIAHSRYTFKQLPSWRSATCYSIVMVISYLINLAVLKWALGYLPAILAQTVAISIFAAISYLGQSRFTFQSKRDPRFH